MVLVVSNSGVFDDELLEVGGCAEEGQEYFNNLLVIPLNHTHIHRSQGVKRWTLSQLLKQWPELIHRHCILADAEAFKK